jgi:hypothetical protein
MDVRQTPTLPAEHPTMLGVRPIITVGVSISMAFPNRRNHSHKYKNGPGSSATVQTRRRVKTAGRNCSASERPTRDTILNGRNNNLNPNQTIRRAIMRAIRAAPTSGNRSSVFTPFSPPTTSRACALPPSVGVPTLRINRSDLDHTAVLIGFQPRAGRLRSASS